MIARSLAFGIVFFVAGAAVQAQERPAPAGPADAAAREAAWKQHQALEEASLFQGLAWRSVGPVIQGGRVVDVEAVPGKPFAFYVAYASGGLWKTENNGHTFTPVFDDQPTVIMGDVAVDPRNPDRVWVGTGENNSSRSSYGGHGVFRSDDGGKTWKHVGLTLSDRIGTILVDPRDSDRVYVAVLGRQYTKGGERGVYRTLDGGKTWERMLSGKGDFVGAVDLVQDPKRPDTLYAALWERSRRPWNFVEAGPGSGIYKSTDGGSTWTLLQGGLPAGKHVGRIGLSLCASKPDVIYACVDNQELLPETEWDLGGALSPKRVRKMSVEQFAAHTPKEIAAFIRGLGFKVDFDAKKLVAMLKKKEITLKALLDKMSDANNSLFATDIRGLEVYRTDDAGKTWRRTHKEPLRRVVHTYGYYFGLVAVAPDDPDRVYVAGVPILRSQDGGKNWKSVHGRGVHVDYHSIWIDPAHPRRMIVGNDGGIDISYDAGDTWRSVDAQPVGQFYTIAVDMKKPYNIYGGTQDNGTLRGSSRSRPGRDKWTFIGGGDGMYVQIDDRDGTVYFGYQFGFYQRRGPRGNGPVRPGYTFKEESLRYNWATPVHLSPHNADIVYFGTQKLFRSMDQGRNWTALSPDLSRAKERGDVPFASITTISESTKQFGLIWVGTDDGYVHVTGDGGVTWQEVTAGLPKDRWVTRVVASTHEKGRAYLSLNGYRDDDITAYVYVTENRGKSWRSIAAGLPAEPVNVVKEDPKQADVLYVGTDRGAYVSLDRGKSWDILAAGLPSVPVHDLVVHPRDRELVAGTHGRSVYVLDARPIQELTPEVRKRDLVLFDVEGLAERRGRRKAPTGWEETPRDPTERRILFFSATEGEGAFEVLDAKDRVLRTVALKIRRGVNVYRWNLELDPKLALPVEADTAAKASEKDGDKKSDSAVKKPWARAVALGYPLRITAGSYTLRVRRGDKTATTKLKVRGAKGGSGRAPGPEGEEEDS